MRGGRRPPDLAAPVRDRVLDEADGNPLALIELPAALSVEQRAGRADPPAPLPASGRVLEAFADRAGRLSERARLALAVAAAEGTGDLGTVLRAGRALAAAPALHEEAARLSPGRDGRARRLTRAAQSAITVGRTVRAAALAERAETLTGDPLLRAGLAMVRATAEFERGTPRGTAGLLADRAGPVLDADPGLALTLLVMAAGNAWAAGEDASIRRVARVAADLVSGPPRGPVTVPCSRAALAERAELERVAAALAALGRVVDGDAAGGMPVLRALVEAARVEAARVEPSGSLIVRLFVIEVALLLGDDRAVAELAPADVGHARRRGLAGALPAALQPLAQAQAVDGLHRDAAATAAEAMVFARDTGQRHRRWRLAAVTARLAAVEGQARECARAAAVPYGEPGADGGLGADGGPAPVARSGRRRPRRAAARRGVQDGAGAVRAAGAVTTVVPRIRARAAAA